ncbi:DcrB-related protein [archaeon]|nr:DcrB-related protein [archaeon]
MIKKIGSALLFVIFLIGCAQNAGLEGYQKYNNDNFDISYPGDWKFSILEGGLIAFASPQENADDTFVENLNVYVSQAQPGLTLDDYVTAGLEQLKQVLPGFKMREVKETTFSGNPARELSYESNSEGASLRLFQLLVMKNNKIFTVTFVAEQAKYDAYSSQLKNILNSFNPK